MGHLVVIGIGSNLGDRESNLALACAGIARLPQSRLQARSVTYESDPVGPPQPKYLNAAVRVQTTLPLEDLLRELQRIETSLGRKRLEHWGPRTIDLDILWSSVGVHQSEILTLPHPHLLDRAFALAPLLDVAPERRSEWGPRLAALGGRPARWRTSRPGGVAA